jgi:hypothetical protein
MQGNIINKGKQPFAPTKEHGFNKIQNLTPATHPLSVYGEGNKRGEVPY